MNGNFPAGFGLHVLVMICVLMHVSGAFCNCSFIEAGLSLLELTSPGTQLLAKCFCLTRLETRTKESNRCASLRVAYLCAQ